MKTKNIKQCSVCNKALFSIYARREVKFFILKGYYFCPNCSKIYVFESKEIKEIKRSKLNKRRDN